MKTIQIRFDRQKSNKRSHEVWIGRGLLEKAATLRRIPVPFGEKKAFLFFDTRMRAWASRFGERLEQAGWKCVSFPVQGGEGLKDFQKIYGLYGELLKKGADRNSVLFAIGGGSVGDAIGFLAGTFLRGVPWINIPTTLLAQVDSAIGGKTGINHSLGKNLIGVFHQPELVICDLALLERLQRRDRISGFGEMVKYALLFDRKFFSELESNWKEILEFGASAESAIARCVELKAGVVSRDELDRSGTRELLNFGHTFGHAFEALAGYGYYRHGEAVLLGMRLELIVSELMGYLSAKEAKRMHYLLQQPWLPQVPRSLRSQAVLKKIQMDKKKFKGKVRFVLLKGFGKPVLETKISEKILVRALGHIGIP